MKKISLILVFLVCFINSFGQVIQRTNNYGSGWKRAIADSMFAVPFKDTISILVEITPVERRSGFITCRPQDSLYYSFNGIKWSRIINYKEFIDSINAVKQLIAGGGVSYTGTQGIVVTGTVISPDTDKLATVFSLTNWLKKVDPLTDDSTQFKIEYNGSATTMYLGRQTSYLKGTQLYLKGSYAYLTLNSPDKGLEFIEPPTYNTADGKVIGAISMYATNSTNGSRTGIVLDGIKYAGTANRNAALRGQFGSGAASALGFTWSIYALNTTALRLGNTYLNSYSTTAEASLQIANTSNLPGLIIDQKANPIYSNFIIRNSSGLNIFNIDTAGSVSANGFLYKKYKTISSSYTVSNGDNYIYVNTASGGVTITLPTTLDTGYRIFVKKISSDNNLVTITSSANIDGDGTLTFADKREITIHYAKPDFWTTNLIQSQDADHVDVSDFGVVADLQRAAFNTVANNDTITATTGIFASTDAGKVIIIHEVRNNTAYSDTAQSLTTIITTYISSTKVVVQDAPDYTRSNKNGYFFTNNFDAIQTALDYAAANNISKLHINKSGTFGIAPQLSTIEASQPLLWKGLTINYPITVEGDGKDTKLKWCIEDDNNVDSADNWYGSGFIINTSGDVSFKNFQAIAPDHICSEMVPHRLTFVKQKTGQVLTGSSITEGVDIIGDSSGGAYDWTIQWSNCFDNSAEAYPGKYNFVVSNSTMMASGQWISIFSSDGAAKRLNIINTPCWYSGSPKLKTVWGNHANITSGDQTLTITGIPGFSWYDFTSQYDNENRKPEIRIKSGSDSVTIRVVSINSPTSAEIDVAPSVTFTNAEIVYIGRGAEGHGIYRHPNVSPTYIGLLAYNTNQWIDHAYTGGGVNGTQEYPTYMQDCGEYTFNSIYPTITKGWMIAKNQTLRHTIKNCDSLTINEYNYSPMVNIYGTVLRGESTFAGNTNLYNCVGGNIYANGDTVKVYGGTYAFIGQINTGDITVFNSNVGTATPSSSVKLYGCYNNSGTAY